MIYIYIIASPWRWAAVGCWACVWRSAGCRCSPPDSGGACRRDHMPEDATGATHKSWTNTMVSELKEMNCIKRVKCGSYTSSRFSILITPASFSTNTDRSPTHHHHTRHTHEHMSTMERAIYSTRMAHHDPQEGRIWNGWPTFDFQNPGHNQRKNT